MADEEKNLEKKVDLWGFSPILGEITLRFLDLSLYMRLLRFPISNNLNLMFISEIL